MEVNEYMGIQVRDTVRPLVGPYKGEACVVVNIDINSSRTDGWFVVSTPDGQKQMFSKDEVVAEVYFKNAKYRSER